MNPIMDKLPPVDARRVYIGFTRGDSFISKAIRFVSEGDVNHVFFLYWSALWGCWMEHGAIGSGFNALPVTTNGLVDGCTCLIDFVGYDLSLGFKRNAQLIGAKYDYTAIPGMVWVEAMEHWFRRNVRNPLQTGSRVFCSEIGGKIVIDSKVPLDIGGRSISSLTPYELKLAALKVPGAVDVLTLPSVEVEVV